MATVIALIRQATERLEAVGIDGARFDAQMLLAKVLGRTRLDLLTDPNAWVDGAAVKAFEGFIRRREAREPVSHILGTREFWSLSFEVNEHTLAPRPDSETLIEAALDHFKDKLAPRRILDLGTGTGCLLLTLLSEFKDAFGVGLDRNPDTAKVAKRNAVRLGLSARTSIVVGDWATALSGEFDLVISNPPYISQDELAGLDPEVVRYEPLGALLGGADGLADYRVLCPEMMRLLSPQGIGIFEIGHRQAEAVSELAQGAGFGAVSVRSDLAQRPRAVILCK